LGKSLVCRLDLYFWGYLPSEKKNLIFEHFFIANFSRYI
jgi:hypothetical protein